MKKIIKMIYKYRINKKIYKLYLNKIKVILLKLYNKTLNKIFYSL